MAWSSAGSETGVAGQHRREAGGQHRQEHGEAGRHLHDQDDAGHRGAHHASEERRHADDGEGHRLHADEVRQEPGQHADAGADQPGPRPHGPPAEPARQGRGAGQRAVGGDRQEAGDDARSGGTSRRRRRVPAGVAEQVALARTALLGPEGEPFQGAAFRAYDMSWVPSLP
jgi:hypothetical protein